MRAVVVALVLALAACSGGRGRVAPAATTAPGAAVAVEVTTAEVVSVATPPPAFPDDLRTAVVGVLDRYVDLASEGPLTTGKPAGPELEALFTAPARTRLTTPDRAALVDEGLERATLAAGRAQAKLTAIAGADGAVLVVVAHLTMELQGRDDAEGLVVARAGDYTLALDGDAWRIDAYDVSVTREVPGTAPTTTAAAAGP